MDKNGIEWISIDLDWIWMDGNGVQLILDMFRMDTDEILISMNGLEWI